MDGCDGVCVVRVEVLAGLGGRCEMGSLNGMYSSGDALECQFVRVDRVGKS